MFSYDALADPLDASQPPPNGRFCDLVIEGGVINGVAYPGFLMEVARRFHLHAVGGASVGAIAASLAVACEYGRRYGDLNGYNEGLRKLPADLAEWMDVQKTTTRIRSLFQPLPELQPLFQFALDLVEESVNEQIKVKSALLQRILKKRSFGERLLRLFPYVRIFYRHFHAPWLACAITLFLGLIGLNGLMELVQGYFSNHVPISPLVFVGILWSPLSFTVFMLFLFFVVIPVCRFVKQVNLLRQTQGFGFCSGMPPPDTRASRSDGSQKEPAPQALTEWLFKGIQDAAGLPYARPLTFGDLWAAPGAPMDANGVKAPRSIDLRTVTACLSHGRMYEIPLKDDTARLFFRLSELKKFFPVEVIDHLRRVSKPVDIALDPILKRYQARRKFLENSELHRYAPNEQRRRLRLLKRIQKKVVHRLMRPEQEGRYDDPDIRELPSADLPIVVAARLSLSVPVLFQAIPMLGFDLDANAEKMDLCRLWFSDGGISSNFPIHLFDAAIPRWPTFGVKVLETGREKVGSEGTEEGSYVPYHHDQSMNDIFVVDPEHQTGFGRAGYLHSKKTPTWATFATFILGIYQTAKDGNDHAYLRTPSVRNRVLRLYTEHATGSALNLKIKPQKIALVNNISIVGGRNLVTAYLDGFRSPRYQKAPLWQEHRWVRFNLLIDALRKHLKGFEVAAQSNDFQLSIFEQIKAARSDAPLQSRENPVSEVALEGAQADQLEAIAHAIIKLERILMARNLPLPYTPAPESFLQVKPKF